jgi:hypothetical protein
MVDRNHELFAAAGRTVIDMRGLIQQVLEAVNTSHNHIVEINRLNVASAEAIAGSVYK